MEIGVTSSKVALCSRPRSAVAKRSRKGSTTTEATPTPSDRCRRRPHSANSTKSRKKQERDARNHQARLELQVVLPKPLCQEDVRTFSPGGRDFHGEDSVDSAITDASDSSHEKDEEKSKIKSAEESPLSVCSLGNSESCSIPRSSVPQLNETLGKVIIPVSTDLEQNGLDDDGPEEKTLSLTKEIDKDDGKERSLDHTNVSSGCSSDDAGSPSKAVASSSCSIASFTPDSLLQQQGSYGDILLVLDKIEENEKNGTRDKDECKKKDGDAKLSELYDFLDSVDEESRAVSTPAKPCYLPEADAQGKHASSILALSKEPPLRLAEKLVRLRFSLEEEERSVNVLKKALEQQKRIGAARNGQFQQELDQRLAQQKDEYEATIKRHQNFIDQLLEDKRSLSERCDVLHQELQKNARKHEESVRNLEHRHGAEVRRLKSLQETSTKLRQEKWVDEKTRRIKEQTVRGLEPEIQRLMSRHAGELSDLQAEKDRALLAQERELHQRHVQHIREIRALWEEEQHDEWQKERKSIAQRHQVQLEDLARDHQSEIERLQDQLRRERERATEERKHLEWEAEQVRRLSKEKAEAEVNRVAEEEEGKRRTLEKRHAAELTRLKENEWADRAEWERECKERLAKDWEEREKKLTANVRAERDSEVEQLMQRLEAEGNRLKADLEREAQERANRLRTKLDCEKREVECENEALRGKINDFRQKCTLLEEEAIVCKASMRQKDMDLAEIKDKTSRLEAERDCVREAVRGEFTTALESLSQEKSQLLKEAAELRLELTEARSQGNAQKIEAQGKMEQEMERIHSRVKSVIMKKDATIGELRLQHQQVVQQVQHLEETLERLTEERVLAKI